MSTFETGLALKSTALMTQQGNVVLLSSLTVSCLLLIQNEHDVVDFFW